MDKYINTPINEKVTSELKSGDYVYITGNIYVARDAAHKRMIEALDRGEKLPIEIEDSTIYYMGPSPARDGKVIEELGTYNPLTNPAEIKVDEEKTLARLNSGAQPTDTARNILSKAGIMKKFHNINQGK